MREYKGYKMLLYKGISFIDAALKKCFFIDTASNIGTSFTLLQNIKFTTNVTV